MGNSFNVGDRVKLLFKVPSNHMGWEGSWVKPMDCGVGKTLVIDGIKEDVKVEEYSCEFPNRESYYLPAFALELVKKSATKKKDKVDIYLAKAKEAYKKEIEKLVKEAEAQLFQALETGNRMDFIRKKASLAIEVVNNLQLTWTACPYCQEKNEVSFGDEYCKKCEYGKLKKVCAWSGSDYEQVGVAAEAHKEALKKYKP